VVEGVGFAARFGEAFAGFLVAVRTRFFVAGLGVREAVFAEVRGLLGM
jgi:hypothetical protein